MATIPHHNIINAHSASSGTKKAYQTPLQRLTAQHQLVKKNEQLQTKQQINQLTEKHQQINRAAVTTKNPMQGYLKQAGKLVEKRISTLRDKVNGKSS
ncbi:MAG: hypothetical protein COU63_04870 [Candidatus Pacebacteria bacterium CG10_big_fil_rev_8_21_14_0_10_36_11]|nr:hypothetical protein [Candidatus Pacearchaeota archaeon]OIP73965.1 MAG: hypothetical protein AUK08_01745 [Candidatus Pacebacteria bacterium CG2_30_36_39]PIR64396.1 MAG: hypothetical protein COU63_04870 [Candidatus Pacebacteria bacterium CG10_big_fil_rev_8_21_14_0_10_36_11]PJC42787.1 MAG: hypothetical protein CO040_02635 [Candidatus Pacebacteria bacterium CG_4_9_14_0_2_um_filter_36_8]